MRLPLAGTAALLLMLAAASGAAAETRYVSKTGSADAGDCSDPASPCFTINYAVEQAVSGDTIQIGPGIYAESVEVAGKSLTLVGAGSGTLGDTTGVTWIRGKSPTSAAGEPGIELKQGGTIRSLRAEGGDGDDGGTSGFIGGDGISLTEAAVNPGAFHIEDVVAVGGAGGSGTSSKSVGGYALRAVDLQQLSVAVEDGQFAADTTGTAGGTIVGILGDQVGAEIRDSRITELEGVPTGHAPGVFVSAGAATTVIEGTRISAKTAIDLNVGTLKLRRSRLHGTLRALQLAPTSSTADVEISNSLLTSPQQPIAGDSFGGSISLDVTGSTIVTEEGFSAALGLNRDPAEPPVTASLRNSILRSADGPLDISVRFSTVTATHSSFDSTAAFEGGTVPTPGSGTNVAGDPGFADPAAGDFSLLPSSPLIDRGDPSIVAAGELDLTENPRSLDGNGDCIAAPDIGAYELTGHECPPAPPLAATQPADPPPELSRFGMTNRVFAPKGKAKPRRGARATARAKRGTKFNFTLSEPARVAIAIERRVRRRKRVRFVRTGTLTASKQGGRQSLPFSGRLRGKPLKPGRYRATIVATDSVGQKSTPRRAAFTVVRP